MRRYLKVAVVLSVFMLACAPAWAQTTTYYARGNFTGVPATDWGTDHPLTDLGNGHWQGTVTGLVAGNSYEFKLANSTWSENWPGSNCKFIADSTGQVVVDLYKSHLADGYAPTGVRVGYTVSGMSWEVIGSFDGWGNPLVALTDEGNGVYSGVTTIANPATYQFKFRKPADWGLSIGADFGNAAPNISFGTTVANQMVEFKLDLPNGRYKVTLIGADTAFDGAVDTGTGQEWASPKASAVQDNYTGYGDQHTGLVLSMGSELDGLYVRAQGDRMYLGITGNLEANGNTIVVFFDTKAGGQNTLAAISGLDGPTAFPNMQADVFDAGFAPDYAMAINTGGGRCDVDWYELTDISGGVHTWRGHVDLNIGSGTLLDGTNPNGLEVAFDNTNILGITTTDASTAGSATTGIEASIPLVDLGLSSLPATLGVQAVLVSTGGFVSSQSLPPTPAGTADPGNGTWFGGLDHTGEAGVTAVDFNTITNPQFASFTLTDQAWSGTLDGRNIPTDFAGADGTALQENPTGWGDQSMVPGVIPGSELDRMLVKEDDLGNLVIGITGNLAADGTNLVIFLDTKAGGETTLTDHGDRLSGNVGDTLPCAADYAILLNRSGGNIWVDLYDLQANVETSPGFIPDNALLGGPLSADPAWILGANLGNLAGVNADAGSDPQTANALTATTGFELLVPRTQIGLPADPLVSAKVHAIAMLTGFGVDREISNQILPAGLGGGKPNFGAGPTDLASAGYACLEIALGRCHTPRFDADGDGDVDQVDFGIVQGCYTGPGIFALSDTCKCFDWNLVASDGDVDQEDLGAFLRCALGAPGIHGSGPMIPADPSCDQP